MLFNGACATDIGVFRQNNQDEVLFKKITKDGQDFALGVICDGVGGLERGEAASQCVCMAASAWFDTVADWIDIATSDADILFSHFKDAVDNWNNMVRDIIINQNIDTGTTMSAILLIREHYFIIHVGDSRIYRLRSNLELMTTDESVAKIYHGKMKLFLMNYVGRDDELSFYSTQGSIEQGDIFIYGSDGFYNMFADEDLDEIFIGADSLEKTLICESLIAKMIQRGERDNISVGIIYCI